jgi:predicted AlkP superfamily phosphohydrolase/phosphomutase
VKRAAILTLVLLCLAPMCAAGEAGAASPKVVLVSLDGAADWLVDDLLARGVLPPDGAVATLARTGVRAEAMIPVAVSMTSPSHVAMFTGAYPERNGIVSNTFLAPGDPISRSSSGFDAPIEAETLWQAARRQGKRVVCATAVGADATAPERTCDLTLAYGESKGWSALARLEPAANEAWSLGTADFEHTRALQAAADSPGPLAYRLDDGSQVPLYALAVDTAFDSSEGYDALILDFDRNLANGIAARLGQHDWALVLLPLGPPTVGSWVKLMGLAPNLSVASVYLGSPSSHRGKPAEFITEIEDNSGPWPGGPDDWHLDRDLIDEDTWREQAQRLNYHLRDAALQALRRAEWDLLITYLPIIDETQHKFLLRDPRQPGYEAEAEARRVRYASYVEWAYQLADGIVQEWMAAAPPGTNFVVVSDHGMIPVHTEVVIHSLLAQAGFHVTADDATEVRAYKSGTTAHLYVNLAGRQPAGVVPAKKLDEYVERIVAACQGLRDPLTGEPVFEVVLRRAELGQVRMGHPTRAGDVWVNARPGYTLSSLIDPAAPVFSPAEGERSQHGNIGTERRIHAIFFAAGPGVEHRYLGTVNGVDVAATVAALLGMEPPVHAEGRAVLQPAR